MTSYFDIIMIPLQVMIVFFTIYYFVLSLFGILPGKKEKKIFHRHRQAVQPGQAEAFPVRMRSTSLARS